MDKCLVITFNNTVLKNQPIDLTHLVPCTIEEVDKRNFLHAKDVAQSNSKILIKTVDGDV